MKKILLLILSVLMSTFTFSATDWSEHVKGITAIAETFGEGQRITGVVLEYDSTIKNSSLIKDSFKVEGRTITKIYANKSMDKVSEGKNGKFVVIELDKNDKTALLFQPQGLNYIKKEPRVNVMQLKDIKTFFGRTYVANNRILTSSKSKNIIMDDFVSFEFKDEAEGKTLKYNLFIPKNYDPKKTYPLVYFGHDAGVTSTDVKATLFQGIGATVWASPEEQSKHECFVVAPQYPGKQSPDYVKTTLHLLKSLTKQYSINTNKIYATGQSGGCMHSIAMAIEEPDFFAAMFLVAGQWDANLMAEKLSNKNMWIVVSQGDEKAFPGMNASTEAMEKKGAKVVRAEWKGTLTPEEIKIKAKEMLSKDANIKYVSLVKGTVVIQGLEDNALNNHLGTWPIAYTFEPIRDWLFTQSK